MVLQSTILSILFRSYTILATDIKVCLYWILDSKKYVWITNKFRVLHFFFKFLYLYKEMFVINCLVFCMLTGLSIYKEVENKELLNYSIVFVL